MKSGVSKLDCIKVIEARNLLESTSLPVESIAEMLGFRSPEHLERVFTQLNRITPEALRDGKK
jgi:transcriptional regulator GlxA family with amidase domain